MPGDENNHSQYIAQQVTAGLEETRKIIQNFQGTLTDLSGKLEVKHEVFKAQNEASNTVLRAEFALIKETIQSLVRLIRGDDHGQNSLLSRLQFLENENKTFRDYIDEEKNEKNIEKNESITLKAEDKRGKWLVIVAAFTACGSLAVTLLNLFIK